MVSRLLFLLILSFSVGAWPLVSSAEMTVGGELEFIHPKVKPSGEFGLKGHEETMAEIFSFELQERCLELGCTEEKVAGKWGEESRFTFTDGFWIQVSWDPSVVEILTKPLKLSVLRKLAPKMQEAIFKTAERAGLVVSPKRAGHFNFGANASFGGDANLFVKFIVDYSNHTELATGILREANLMTAPPLAALKLAQRVELAKHANIDYSGKSIAEVSQILIDSVFHKTVRENLTQDWSVHNQALGLKKVPDATSDVDQPMEARAVRSQNSIFDLVLLGELFEARIAYLKTRKVALSEELVSEEKPRLEFSSQELVDRFYLYVTESGLAWSRYQALLPEGLRKLQPTLRASPNLRALRCEAAF